MRSARRILALVPLVAAAVAAPAARAAADAGALPAPVKEYVAGWLARDGARVDKVVDEDGGYRDAALFAPVSGPDLADYVDGFQAARVELLEARKADAEHVDLTWRITWPDARGALTAVDPSPSRRTGSRSS